MIHHWRWILDHAMRFGDVETEEDRYSIQKAEETGDWDNTDGEMAANDAEEGDSKPPLDARNLLDYQQESSHSQTFDERLAIGHRQMWLDPDLTCWKDRFQSGQDLRARILRYIQLGLLLISWYIVSDRAGGRSL